MLPKILDTIPSTLLEDEMKIWNFFSLSIFPQLLFHLSPNTHVQFSRCHPIRGILPIQVSHRLPSDARFQGYGSLRSHILRRMTKRQAANFFLSSLAIAEDPSLSLSFRVKREILLRVSAFRAGCLTFVRHDRRQRIHLRRMTEHQAANFFLSSLAIAEDPLVSLAPLKEILLRRMTKRQVANFFLSSLDEVRGSLGFAALFSCHPWTKRRMTQ